VARTNLTSLGINSIGKNDADIEAEVFRHQPITPEERDAIPNPVNGMKVYNSIRNEIEGYIDGSWPICAIQTFGYFGAFPKLASVVQTGTTEAVTTTQDITQSSFNGAGPMTNTAFRSNTGPISTEITIKSGPSAVHSSVIVFTQLEGSGAAITGVGVIDLGNGTIQLFGTNGGTLTDFFAFSFPYTISVNLDQAAGTATYEFLDNAGTTFSGPVPASPDYDNTKFTYIVESTALQTMGQSVTLDFNAGTSAFSLANSQGKLCDYENNQFCAYDIASVHNASGTTFANTGGIQCIGSLATSTIIQQTSISATSGIATNEVEYSASANATTSEEIEASFVDANSSSPNEFCGVIANPQTGKIIDTVSATELKTGVTMAIGYKIWVNFTLSGTAIYKDTQGNTGSITVSGYTPGDNVFYSNRARADTLGDSEITAGYNSGEKTFADPTAVGKCTL